VISAIIPNYNNAPWLRECIGSLADAAVSEIVVYDDGSTDSSLEILRSLADPRLKILQGDGRSLGAYRARTAAVKAATNPVIFLLDGDDRLSPGTVTSAHEALARNDLDIAIPAMTRFDAGGSKPFVAAPEVVIDGRTAFSRTLGNWEIHPMGAMRRELYLATAEKVPPFGYSDDEFFSRQLLLDARRVGPSAGTYEARIVSKPASPEQLIGRLSTQARTIQLARLAGFGDDVISALQAGHARALLRAPRQPATRQMASAVPFWMPGWNLRDTVAAAACRLQHLF
jgi:glycosyltransferase involved in cell wall biosynthesis